jgi:hypothetical protein
MIREEDIQSYETVNNVAKTKSQNVLSKDRQLPAHLQNVFESGQVGLDKDQNEKFRNLLIEYSSIFSETSEDIGFTDLMEHSIV